MPGAQEIPPTAFNGAVSETFAGHAETVRGYLRYELVRRNLAEIVTGQELQVADVGGGAAIDALWLSSLGHDVTVVDPATDQLEKAAQKIAAVPAEQAARLHLVRGTIDDLIAQGKSRSYDLVLSHGVAMYLDDPGQFIGGLISLVRPAGYLSLLEKGFYGAKNSLLHEKKYEEVRRLEATGRLVNHQQRDVWAFKPEDILTHIENHTASRLTSWTGVRVTRDMDERNIADVGADELAEALDAEYAAGRREDLRAAAPMLHFVTRVWRHSAA